MSGEVEGGAYDRVTSMIRTAVTVSLVEQARRGPFVFHGDLESGCRQAAELGFDAIELFAPSGEVIRGLPLRRMLSEYGLQLAAVGTGAGMVVHKLQLCDVDPGRRGEAEAFIRGIMEAGAEFGAPAIIGSMQGRWDDIVNQAAATEFLKSALERLGECATGLGTVLFYEPLNRYETNMCTTMQQGAELLGSLSTHSVRLLADLFHMNIEETSLSAGLRDCGRFLGHVHFVDSNRQAAGRGHMDYGPVAAVLREMGYVGYLSAEAFPTPDSRTAAEQTIETFRSVFGKLRD